MIYESLSKYKLNPEEYVFEALAQSGQIVLLLDAFDEVGSSEIAKCVGDIETLADKYKDEMQIIITARPDSDIQQSSRFRTCKLSPLRPLDHLPFLQKICSNAKQAESLHNAIISNKSGVSALLTTPLMMTLLVMLYKSMQTVPDSVPRFYEELFDVMFYRHDDKKPGYTRERYTELEDTKIKTFFSAFCFYAGLKNSNVFSMEQFDECCNLAKKASGITVDSKAFKNEIVKTACLMLEEGFVLSFIHKSVLEYFAASFVKKSNEDFAIRFYSKLLNNSLPYKEWRTVVNFLSYIDEYRYSKYLILPLISKIEMNTNIDFSNNIPLENIKNIRTEFEEMDFLTFNHIKDNQYQVSGSMRMPLDLPIMDTANDRWLSVLIRPNPKEDHVHDLTELLEQKKVVFSGDKKMTSPVKISDCIHLLPATMLNRADNNATAYIKSVKETAVKIVDREDKNVLLIDELLPEA